MTPLDALISCEKSQVIAAAFRALGHNAYSNDLDPCTGGHPEWHLQIDARLALRIRRWDLVIAHPVCTRMANSGALRLYKGGKKANGPDPVKWAELEEAAEFFRVFLNYSGVIAIENPIMHGHAKRLIGEQQTQIIQPYQFGDDASKATCLWLHGLPPLQPTKYFPPRIVDGKPRWSNQTDGGQNKLPPSERRGEENLQRNRGSNGRPME